MSRKTRLSAILSGEDEERPQDALSGVELTDVNRQPSDANASPELTPVKSGPPPWNRVRSGAVRGLSLSLRETAETITRLEDGTAVADLEPDVLDASFVRDRIDDASDPTFAAFVEGIRDRGQQVPILVRPNPSSPGRYQIAYGHRRARAAATLGRTVRAIIRMLSDEELVVAQGKENLERRDLSYMERALFAHRLESIGLSRATICAAMAADETEVSRYVALARAVPEVVIVAIGPAPKVGRPRWMTLADRIKVAPGRAEAVIAEPNFADRPTDDRFAAVLAALASPQPKTPKAQVWKDNEGRKLARVERSKGRFAMTIDETLVPGFGDFILDQLPEILAAYRQSKG